MTIDFQIRIQIDGEDAAQQAGKIRAAIEKKLGSIQFSTELDTSTANAIKRMFSYAGDEAENLERAAKALHSMGDVDPEQLESLHQSMLAIKRDAKGIGTAMADGMAENWGSLEGTLRSIQQQVTGIISRSPMEDFGGITQDIQGFDEAMSAGSKKAVSTLQKIKELEGRIKGATEEIGRLGTRTFQPLSGAATTSMDALFEGFASGGYKSYISRLKNKITRELEQMTVEVGGEMVNIQEEIARRIDIGAAMRDKVIEGGIGPDEVKIIQQHYDQLGVQIMVSAEGLRANMAQVQTAINEHMAVKPPEHSPGFTEWQQQLQQLSEVKLQIDREIAEARGTVYDTETTRLLDILNQREQELREEHAGHLALWEEFGMESLAEVKEALEREGQSAAAATINKMVELQERVKKLQGKQKDQFAKLQQGGTAEMPKDAQGTLVDFITAERALEQAVKATTPTIDEQTKAFEGLIEAMDDASKASEGMGYIERRASQELEAAARREISKRTRASVPLDQAAENTRDVLSRLAGHIESLREATENPMRQAAEITGDASKAAAGDIAAMRTKLEALQEQALEEIDALPRRDVDMDTATAGARDVLQRLAQEIEELQTQAAKPIDAAKIDTAQAASDVAQSVDRLERELTQDPTTGAQENAKGLVAVWQWVSDKLVGHSIVPEMVAEINRELKRIDTQPLDNVRSAAVAGPTGSDMLGADLYQQTRQNPAVGNAMLNTHSTTWWAAYTDTFVTAQEGMLSVAQNTEQEVANAMRHSDAQRNTKTAARAILDEWNKTADALVGHSIIPEMVRDINAWLDRIDPDKFLYDKMTTTAKTTAQEVTENLSQIAQGIPVEKISSRIGELKLELDEIKQEYKNMAVRGGESHPMRTREFNEAWDVAEGMRWEDPESRARDAAARLAGKLPRGVGYRSENLTEGDEDDYYSVVSTEMGVKERYNREESARLDEMLREQSTKEAQYATLIQSLYERQEKISAAFAELSDDPLVDESILEAVYQDLEEVTDAIEQIGNIDFEVDTAAGVEQKVQGSGASLEIADEIVNAEERELRIQEQRAQNRSAETYQIKEEEKRRTLAMKAEAAKRAEINKAHSAALREEEKRTTIETREAEKRKTIDARGESKEREYLTRAQFETVKEAAKQEVVEVREAEKRKTIETRGAVKAREQLARTLSERTKEAEKRKTAQARSRIRLQEQEAKLILKAQQLAAELGEDWETVEAGMQASGQSAAELVGSLTNQKKEAQELARANRQAAQETSRRNALEQKAQQTASQIGIAWGSVNAAANATGLSMEEINRELTTIVKNQRETNVHSRRLRENYKGILGTMRLFGDEVNAASRESEGLMYLSRNLETVARNMGRSAVVIKGALLVAGRDYKNFLTQADIGSRALNLDADLNLNFREQIIEQATQTGIDPEEIARGITSWAHDVNVAIESEAELNNLLEHTIPLQKTVAMTGVDFSTLATGAAAAINQYGMELEDTAYIASVFTKVADETLASVADVTGSFKMISGVAQRADESFEETAAAMTILGERGIKATQAGTGYQQMLTNLLVPSSERARDALRDMFGTEDAFFDAEGKYVGTAKAIEMLAEETKDLSDQEREANLNALFDQRSARIAAVLIQEQIEAREEGYNALIEKEREIRETSMEGYERQEEQLENSEVQRIRRLQQEWKALWLKIGQQGVELVLPVVEQASDILGEVTQFVSDNPQLVRSLAVAAGGGIVISRLLAGANTALNTINMARSLAKGAWGAIHFKTTVITSAEMFRQIVTTGAAQQAATTTAATAGLTGVLGFAAKAILGPLAAIYAGAKIYDEFIADKIGGASLEQFGAVAAYAMGEALEKIGLGEDLGEKWFSARAGIDRAGTSPYDEQLAAGGIYAPPPTLRTDTRSGDDMLRDFGIMLPGTGIDGIKNLDGAIKDLGDTARDVGNDFYNQGDRGPNAGQKYDTEQMENAVDHYIELLQRQEEAVDDFNIALADAVADLHADLADMEKKYNQEIGDIREDYQEDTAEREAERQRQRQKALEEHNKRMRRMREDHESRVWDLELARDAAGLYKERQRYQKEKARAEEDFATAQQEEVEQHQREQAKRHEQYQERLRDIQEKYHERRAERIREHDERVAEMRLEHEEEMSRIKKEYFNKINAELEYYTQSQEQRNAYYEAMLKDTEVFLANNRNIWLQHLAQLPTPSYSTPTPSQSGGGLRARAAGGYIRSTEPHLMHAGEFVMSAGTTRQIEGAMGGRLNQSNVRRLGGVRVNASFNGMQEQDRAWFKTELRQFERELTEALS